MGWLSGWAYRRPIIITNNITSALTNYQVLIIIDTQTLISQGKMRSDGGDIRFTDSDGVTLIDYWVESGINTNSTRIWVKVPFIPASPEIAIIYLYYGNPSATSLSNGFNTFDSFDDFDDGIITDWTSDNAYLSLTEANGVLRATIGAGTGSVWACAYRSVSFGAGYAIEAKMRLVQNGQYTGMGIAFGWSTYNTKWYSQWNTYPEWRVIQLIAGTEYVRAGGSTNVAPTLNTWYDAYVRITSSTIYAKIGDRTELSYASAPSGKVGLHARNASSGTGIVEFDNFRVRKYVSPEPSVSIGSEVVIVANSFPMLYIAKPIKAQELISKVVV
jgi:hypothetical protein